MLSEGKVNMHVSQQVLKNEITLRKVISTFQIADFFSCQTKEHFTHLKPLCDTLNYKRILMYTNICDMATL